MNLGSNSQNLRVEYRGVDYTWSGGFGSIIESNEDGVKQDEVRQFGSETLYAWRVDRTRGWGGRRICWSKHGVNAEWIQEFKRQLFST